MASGTSVDKTLDRSEESASDSFVRSAPVVIEARGIEKTFKIPSHRIDSLKERAVHPFSSTEYRELRALRGISFDIHRGEFFGIMGRNGSGKSTLLKLMASIYRADGGTVRMAGRVAPFIELGVGFNTEFTARENVVLNGVMMGLSRREARRRLDTVLDFAELRDFVDLKLKNYSSGMMVRLAFSVMIQSDAEVLLIDEVLAVGDAAFQQKCADVFHQMRRDGRTIVLVTHDMGSVQRYCHRAMLLHDGVIRNIGEPEEVAREYLRLNFERGIEQQGVGTVVQDLQTKLHDAWIEAEDGRRVENLEAGEPIRLHAVLEARQEMESPIFVLHCSNEDGIHVFELSQTLTLEDGQQNRLRPGQEVRVSGTIENPLTPGRYQLGCWVASTRDGGAALQGVDLLSFVVFGTAGGGLVTLSADLQAVPKDPELK